MRKQTRRYTTSLPYIGPESLAFLRGYIPNGNALKYEALHGILVITRRGGNLMVSIGGHSFPLLLTTTQVGFGVRYWYQCPQCCRRASKLYINPDILACRECSGLHYASQSKSPLQRCLQLGQRANARSLALWPDYWNQMARVRFKLSRLPKPAGMRWDTFNRRRLDILRLRAKHCEFRQKLSHQYHLR
ncbi:hypothetical protein SerAS12_4082 [Serratia sp. AS12]|nr:hypothetical protein SerAS9_4081 [Serratia plymuthica AS9]AEF52132.1 hypothetical protein SerAS12_4082 [Serratia sp. AS12]AEG29839.1 hypothetical protein SerAS13_4082 [Serratia sp. AS13]